MVPEARVTRREAEVLRLVGDRFSNDEIASALFVSKRTVESHVSSLMRKLGVDGRRALAELARTPVVDGGSAAPPVPAAIDLAVDSAPLVGRTPERAALGRLWERARGGRVVMAVLTGEAGIGKTRLAADLAVTAHAAGADVLLGACYEDQPAALGPFVEAIAEHLGRRGDDARRSTSTSTITAAVDGLDRLLVGPGAPDRGPDGLVDREAEQAALLDTIRAYLETTTRDRPAVLVVEDAHWATASTTRALRDLARVPSRMPLLVVVTARDTGPETDDESRGLLDDLDHAPNAHVVRLGGLDTIAVAELAAGLATGLGGAAPTDLEALHTETGGNPLFVREVVRGGGERRAGASLGTLVARRSALLAAGDNAVLDLASVIGAAFDVRLLAAASGTDLAATLDALERAEAAGLVRGVPGEPGRWIFAHSLFRSLRYDAIGSARRMRLHAAVAEVLAARHDPDETAVTELARHSFESHLIGDVRLAVSACVAAGDRAARILAVDEAAGFYRRAIEATRALDPPDQALRLTVNVRLGSILHNAGDPEGIDLLLAAADQARQVSDGGVLADIAWSYSYNGSGTYGRSDESLRLMVDDALALPDLGAAARARLLALRAAGHAFSGDMERVPALCDSAVAAARATGDPVTLAQVLMTVRLAMSTPSNLRERYDVATELEVLGEDLGLPMLVVHGRLGRASMLRERGQLVASSEVLYSAAAMLGARPPVWCSVLATALHSSRLLLQGDLRGAEAAADALLEIESGSRRGTGAWIDPAAWRVAHVLAVRRYQGRLGEEVDTIASNAEALGPLTDALLTCALAHAHRWDEARTRLDRRTASAFGDVVGNLPWLSSMTLYAEAAELTGHTLAARQLAEHLTPFADRLDNFGDGSFGPVAIALVQLAVTLDDSADDLGRVAATALATCRRIGSPIFVGRALAYTGPSGDAEASAIARDTGAALIEQDIARLRRR